MISTNMRIELGMSIGSKDIVPTSTGTGLLTETGKRIGTGATTTPMRFSKSIFDNLVC